MSTINIYVDGGDFSSPYYNFYTDSGGSTPFDGNLNTSNTYVFRRLGNAATHAFYISDQGYKQINSGQIDITGDGSAASGITGTETLTLKFNDSWDDTNTLFYYCTAHDSMQFTFTVNKTYFLESSSTGVTLFLNDLNDSWKSNNSNDSSNRFQVKEILMNGSIDNLHENFLVDITYDTTTPHSLLVDGKGNEIKFKNDGSSSRNGIIKLDFEDDNSIFSDNTQYGIRFKNMKINNNNTTLNENNSTLFKTIEGVGSKDTHVATFDSVHLTNAKLDKKSSGFVPESKGTYEFNHSIFEGNVENDDAAGFILNGGEDFKGKINNSLAWVKNDVERAGFVNKDFTKNTGNDPEFEFNNSFTNKYFTMRDEDDATGQVLNHDKMDIKKSYTTKEYKKKKGGDSTDDTTMYNNWKTQGRNQKHTGYQDIVEKRDYKEKKPSKLKWDKDNDKYIKEDITDDDFVLDSSNNGDFLNDEENEKKQRNMLDIIDPNNEKYRIDNKTGEIYLKKKKYEISKYKDDNGIEFLQFDGADLSYNKKNQDIVIKLTATNPPDVTDPEYVGVAMPGFKDYVDRLDIKLHRYHPYKFVFDTTDISDINIYDSTGALWPLLVKDNLKLNNSFDFHILPGDVVIGVINHFLWITLNTTEDYLVMEIVDNESNASKIGINILPEMRRMTKRTIYTNTLDNDNESHKFEGMDWIKVKLEDEDITEATSDIENMVEFKHGVDKAMFSVDASGHLFVEGKPLYQYNDLAHNMKYDEENGNNKDIALWDENIKEDNMRYKNTKGHNYKVDIEEIETYNTTVSNKYRNAKYNITTTSADEKKIPSFFRGVSPNDGKPPMEKKYKDIGIDDNTVNRNYLEKIRTFAKNINNTKMTTGVASTTTGVDFSKLIQAKQFGKSDRIGGNDDDKRKRRKIICKEIFDNCHKDLKVLEIDQDNLPFDLADIKYNSDEVYGQNKSNRKIKLLNHLAADTNGDLTGNDDPIIEIDNLNGFYCPKDAVGEQLKVKFKFKHDSTDTVFKYESIETDAGIQYSIKKDADDSTVKSTENLNEGETSLVDVDGKGNILITAGSDSVTEPENASTSGDPYITPLYGKKYKLPNKNATYCLFGLDNIMINTTVRKATLKMENQIRKYYVKKHGPVPKNLKLITDGYFYKQLFFYSEDKNLFIDLETKQIVSNDEKMEYFKINIGGRQKENYGIFKNEAFIKTTIQFDHSEHGIISFEIKFYDNPQIRNGINFKNIVNTSEAIGLCITNYHPQLMEIKNKDQNNINYLKNRIESIPLKNRFIIHDIKKGEKWITK